jgi:hypothetical protein
MKHKEFRANPWKSLFKYSDKVFLAKQLSNFPPPSSDLFIFQLYQSGKRLPKRTYCCNYQSSQPHQLGLGDANMPNIGNEISMNGVQKKRPG